MLKPFVMNSQSFKASIWAGLIAGAVFMMLEMIMVPVFMGGSPWGPPRMIAAIVLGQDVLPTADQPASFDFGVLMAAMMLHFILSIIYAVIFGWICRKLSLGIAVLVGVVGGLLIYFINFYGFTAAFPWFAMARSWVSIVSHIMFGAVAAYSFKKLYQPQYYSHKIATA
jgi:uncharacterized membrane protein YagU involved in acid resistance